ncbi:hypothetical protein QN277_021053 [Acacia crassicarpa]|uniref:Rho termination factor-like N-terminal domain-containing protein n=1 Tax=Acacia crassicarpa TaxID=499986 RepID=A0AAE1MT46_9FABA|nr:hypothetical protein QN277_021053 [Acacia crassicarpa]
MAWDLWSSSYDQDVQDGTCSEHTGWQCDTYFGSGYDVIEEDALNEKSCIDVLRILIRKEDAEIEELGKELLSLQSELACAQHEKWPELCFSALTEKINWLDVSIRNLKNHHADDRGTRPLLHYKPAEPLHEIMKAALQRDYSQDACGQELIAKDSVEGPNLRAISCASGHSDGMELSYTSNLEVSGNDEVIKVSDQVPNSSFSKDMENAPKEAEVVPERNAIVEYDSAYAPRVAAAIKCSEMRLGSMMSDSQQSKSGNDGNSDLDQKPCDFASESEGRLCSKELILLDEDSDIFKPLQMVCPQQLCLPNKESEGRLCEDSDIFKPLQMVCPQQLCLPNKELSFLKGDNDENPPKAMSMKKESLIPSKQQTMIIPYSRSRLKGEEKSPARGRRSETYVNPSKSNMSSPSKQQNQWKRKPDLDSLSDRKPRNSPIKLRPKASTISTSRGQQKPSNSIICVNQGRSNKSLVGKITETELQPGQDETGECAIVPFDSNFSALQKKRKVEAQTSVLQPDRDKLKDLKLADLRLIAKQNSVRGYYKLKKADLVELLKERLSSRRILH